MATLSISSPEARPATSARAVAELYGDLLDVFVADDADAGSLDGLACRVVLAPTLMSTLADKEALARTVLRAAEAP